MCATPTRVDLLSSVSEGMHGNWTNGEVIVNVLQRVWMEDVVFQRRNKANRILG